MKKLYTLLSVLVIAITANAQNLVSNPTFANALTGWSATGTGYALPTHVTNDGQDDNFSVKYIATATTGFDQKFSVVPGQPVTVSFWYKAARTNGATTGNTARIWSVFQAEGSTTPIDPAGTTQATDPLRNSNTYLAQATTWTQVTVTSQVPAGAATFTLQLRAYNGATVSFDNISFSSPGAMPLSTKGFNTIEGLNIYPNPVTNGKFFISTEANAEKSVVIFDVLGKQVVKTTATESVNVSNLNAGVYIVKITEEGKTATRKLVIK